MRGAVAASVNLVVLYCIVGVSWVSASVGGRWGLSLQRKHPGFRGAWRLYAAQRGPQSRDACEISAHSELPHVRQVAVGLYDTPKPSHIERVP